MLRCTCSKRRHSRELLHLVGSQASAPHTGHGVPDYIARTISEAFEPSIAPLVFPVKRGNAVANGQEGQSLKNGAHLAAPARADGKTDTSQCGVRRHGSRNARYVATAAVFVSSAIVARASDCSHLSPVTYGRTYAGVGAPLPRWGSLRCGQAASRDRRDSERTSYGMPHRQHSRIGTTSQGSQGIRTAGPFVARVAPRARVQSEYLPRHAFGWRTR